MLTQQEFEYLIGLKKVFKDDSDIILGPPPIRWSREILSTESKDTFILDVNRSSIDLKKYSYNKRYRTTTVLLRFCSKGIHRNPTDQGKSSVQGAHVHIYRDGFDDKWAFPVSDIGVTDVDNLAQTLTELLTYCNLQNCPTIQTSLI